MLNAEIAETRVKRLVDALSTATKPLLRLREHVDDLEKLVSAKELIQAACVAALIRAEALQAEMVLGTSLHAVEEAAEGLVTA